MITGVNLSMVVFSKTLMWRAESALSQRFESTSYLFQVVFIEICVRIDYDKIKYLIHPGPLTQEILDKPDFLSP